MNNVTISGVGPPVNSQFGDLRTARKFPIIELTSVYGISTLRDIVTTTGAATITNNSTEYILSTTAAGTDSAALESAERGRYESGFAGEAGIAARLPAPPTGNQVARWGMFDSQNGAFFGQSVANGIFVAIRRAGTDIIVPQASWNVDPLNGTGPSGVTLNLAKGNIFEITFTWYGYGVIEFRVVIANPITLAQEVITVHRYAPSGQTSFADPNLPLRGEVSNGGTASGFSLFIGGRQYSIIGDYNPIFRITSDRRTVTNIPVGGTVPILSFRRKTVFPAGSGRTNSVLISLEGADLISTTDISFQVVLDGTINGSYVNFPTANTIIPDNETALLVNNTATTISGGEVVYQGVSAGGTGISRLRASVELLNFELPDTSIVTLTVTNLGNSPSNTVYGTFRLTESW